MAAVYELRKVLDNPIFEGFGSGKTPSLLGRDSIRDDFFPPNRGDWNWKAERLTPLWRPFVPLGRVRAFHDFPCLSMMIPAFSRRAADGLRDFLELNGELLPLASPVGEFYAYNCTTIVEILDHEKSTASWMNEPVRPAPASSISYFSLIPEKVEGLTIFRMRELCNYFFVTQTFVDRVRALGLNGFNCVKVWPLPEGTSYLLEYAKLRRERGAKVKSASGLKEVKGESLVIDFPLQGAKISAEEKKAIARFQDELDAQLVSQSLDDVYFGSLEGRTTSKGKTRLVLSCPDCPALLEKLRPWLKTLGWHTTPLVYLRHGSWDDTAVEEVPVAVC